MYVRDVTVTHGSGKIIFYRTPRDFYVQTIVVRVPIEIVFLFIYIYYIIHYTSY